MAAGKKRKKPPPGGAAGAPPRSEPRVQLFTKFAGCDFRLSTRDFDHIFDDPSDEAQTDLMPNYMAIQNNASINGFGGIETRENLVKLFDAPAGIDFTGVSTLIGDKLFAAANDMTIRYGTLPADGTSGSLSGTIGENSGLTDNNGFYGTPVEYSSGGMATLTVAASGLTISQETGSVNWSIDIGSTPFQTFTATQEYISAVSLWCKNYSAQSNLYVRLYRGGTELAAAQAPAGASFGWVTVNFNDVPCRAGETLKLVFSSGGDLVAQASANSPGGPYSGGYADGMIWGTPSNYHPSLWDGDFKFRVYEKSGTYSYTQARTVVSTGVLTKVQAQIDGPQDPTGYIFYYITHNGTLVFQGYRLLSTDVELMHPIIAGDAMEVSIQVDASLVDTGSCTIKCFEAPDDNNWTWLGYADDKLVGTTANRQLWIGSHTSGTLENAKFVADPTVPLSLTHVVGSTPLALATTPTGASVNRISVGYTFVNKYGPTKISPLFTFYSAKPTSEWSSAAYAVITGAAGSTIIPPSGSSATAVELYYTEGEYQDPAFLGRAVINPVDRSWRYVWSGYSQLDASMWLVSNLTLPAENYTNGVPASQMAVLDGQAYFWGNPTHPYRIWVGGNPGNRFSISPGTGGGFVDCEPGIGTVVKNVLKFKTQQGAAIVTALCDNPNSQREHRYNLVESTISISDEQSSKGWMAEKIAGTVGCKSNRGAVVGGDGLYAVSRYGLAITTLTMEYNSQLQVMYVSDPISPVFSKMIGRELEVSVLFAIDGVLYMTFGSGDDTLDNILFCYDIGMKAWWTYTLDTDTPILNMIHIDYEGLREGIGIFTKDAVYLLPTTKPTGVDVLPTHSVLIESGELTTMPPIQGMHHLSQLEFRFDYFIGEMDIVVEMVDQFGRNITTTKHINHTTLQHQLSEYIRVDAVVESYRFTMSGPARFRMTHFLAKLYPKSNRIGMVYGFDSGQSHQTRLMRRAFNSYNDLKEAIIP